MYITSEFLLMIWSPLFLDWLGPQIFFRDVFLMTWPFKNWTQDAKCGFLDGLEFSQKATCAGLMGWSTGWNTNGHQFQPGSSHPGSSRIQNFRGHVRFQVSLWPRVRREAKKTLDHYTDSSSSVESMSFFGYTWFSDTNSTESLVILSFSIRPSSTNGVLLDDW